MSNQYYRSVLVVFACFYILFQGMLYYYVVEDIFLYID